MNNPEDLTAVLAEPATITVAGKPIAIKPLTISQLPSATHLATALFADETLRLDQDDFVFSLTQEHITLMTDLVVLMTDCPREALDLPITEFMTLFNAVLEFNANFFLMAMMKAMAANQTPTGSTSSSASKATDTPVRNS